MNSDQVSIANQISPKTMSVTQSMVYFTRYLAQRRDEIRVKNQLGGLSKEDIDSKLKSKLWRSSHSIDSYRLQKVMHEIDEEYEKLSFRETVSSLKGSLKELMGLVGYDSSLLIPCFGFASLAAFANAIIPHFYSACVNCLMSAATCTQEEVLRAVAGLGISTALCAIFTGLRGSLFWIAGSRANYNMRVKLHRNLLLQETAFFDSTETGTLLSRLNNDVNKIGNVISFNVNVVFRQTAQFIFGSVYLMKISRSLSYVAFGGIAIVAIISAVYGKFSRILAERVQDTFAEATAVAETSFSMSETVRAFDGVESESIKYEASQYRALQLEEVQAWAYGSHKFVSDIVEAALQGMLLLACFHYGRKGGLPIKQLTTFMFYVNFVLESSNEVGDQWAKIQGAFGASRNVFDLIRRVPSVSDPPTTTDESISNLNELKHAAELGERKGQNFPIIEMSNMSVTYGAMESPALDDINLNIYDGDVVAIVGRSGSGKSSLLRTLLRFYDPSSGDCKLEGISFTDLCRKEIASKVVVVEQEPHVFPMSLIENVLYGIEKDAVDGITGDEIYSETWRSKAAEALEVAGLPIEGATKNDLGLELDTRVGEGGRTLSGGQRQRVAIARALIRQPNVLLLDEPTAALDSKSEKIVVGALKNAQKRTNCIVMVTHRLGVIRSLGVNKVVVLERGKIAEIGHPEQLLKQNGIFAQLAREQGITSQEPKIIVSDVSNAKKDHEQHNGILE